MDAQVTLVLKGAIGVNILWKKTVNHTDMWTDGQSTLLEPFLSTCANHSEEPSHSVGRIRDKHSSFIKDPKKMRTTG